MEISVALFFATMLAMKKYLKMSRMPANRRRRAAWRMAERVLRDERGGEVLEYALVTGLVVTGVITAIGCVGGKVLARWNSISSSV